MTYVEGSLSIQAHFQFIVLGNQQFALFIQKFGTIRIIIFDILYDCSTSPHLHPSANLTLGITGENEYWLASAISHVTRPLYQLGQAPSEKRSP